jgi:glyoxylase-like metal-dependent hydrolase (beta-lactamase superfamily II)
MSDRESRGLYQGQRNGCFSQLGAEIVALERTVKTQRAYGAQHLAKLTGILGERLAGTEPLTAAAPSVGDQARLELGGASLELLFLGDAHFPGDAVVWLPEQGVLFTGDLVYTDRLLGVLSSSQVRSWRAAFERMKRLGPEVIVPGHGSVGDLAKAQRDTGAYLGWIIKHVGVAQADWEPLDEVVERLAEPPNSTTSRIFTPCTAPTSTAPISTSSEAVTELQLLRNAQCQSTPRPSWSSAPATPAARRWPRSCSITIWPARCAPCRRERTHSPKLQMAPSQRSRMPV